MTSPRMHSCGACGARLFTARFRDSGFLVHVERVDNKAPGPTLELVPDLPGVADTSLPHVTPTNQRQTPWREHRCPKVTSYSRDNFNRKVRQ